jgi:hypothetical protein
MNFNQAKTTKMKDFKYIKLIEHIYMRIDKNLRT